MSTKITAKEYSISNVFSKDFQFFIPPYQRPYAWNTEQAYELFDDIFTTFNSGSGNETYFIGSIVLIKEEGKPRSEVIDGQQRLTTLTILLSVLRDKLSDSYRKGLLTKYILEEGNELEDLPSFPRLTIRERERSFFKYYIQDGKLDELLSIKSEMFNSESEKHIAENTKQLSDLVSNRFDNESSIYNFTKFLVSNCFLVIVATPDMTSAYRIFSVLNTRGLSLLPGDIIKSVVIGALSENDRPGYTKKWEDTEVDLTRDGFNDLLGQIRMIRLKNKPRKSIQEEYNESIINDLTPSKAKAFMDNTLFKYSGAYDCIKNNGYQSADNADKVNGILKWLNKIDNTDWLPVAMSYYIKCFSNTDAFYSFLLKLERLAVFMRTASWDVNHRIARYAEILEELESCNSSSGYNGSRLNLTLEEKDVFLRYLNGDIYNMPSKKRNYLILRLDSFVSDGSASYDSKVFSIEHVLPQTMYADSGWAKNWTEEQHKEWIHKIGNLVPLNKRINSSAQNYDFEEKKEKYFKSKNGTSSYTLTTGVLNEDVWTPTVVENRQTSLIDIFADKWELR